MYRFRRLLIAALLATLVSACGDDASKAKTGASPDAGNDGVNLDAGNNGANPDAGNDGVNLDAGNNVANPDGGNDGANDVGDVDMGSDMNQTECPDGFEGDGVTCTDIDECDTDTHNCGANAACANTDGGFTCTCDAGYSGDGVNCTDVDECAVADPCSADGASCANTDGSYTCTCPQGDTHIPGTACVTSSSTEDEICTAAAYTPGFLDQYQDVNDGSVLFCHLDGQGNYSLVNSSQNSCLTHWNNHRSETTMNGRVVQTGDVFPTTGCDA